MCTLWQPRCVICRRKARFLNRLLGLSTSPPPWRCCVDRARYICKPFSLRYGVSVYCFLTAHLITGKELKLYLKWKKYAKFPKLYFYSFLQSIHEREKQFYSSLFSKKEIHRSEAHGKSRRHVLGLSNEKPPLLPLGIHWEDIVAKFSLLLHVIVLVSAKYIPLYRKGASLWCARGQHHANMVDHVFEM